MKRLPLRERRWWNEWRSHHRRLRRKRERQKRDSRDAMRWLTGEIKPATILLSDGTTITLLDWVEHPIRYIDLSGDPL